MGAEDLEDPDDLYGLPLEEFVAARDGLAKRLRAGGDRAAADAVKRLPKPSAAAWAVNQAVRSQPRAARALWEAGDELAATQERLLAGDADRDALRSAMTAEREALAPLLEAARGLLTGSGAGVSETALARVEESLHAAALDPEVRPEVAAGRLAKEVRHVGMGTAPRAGAGALARAPAGWGGRLRRRRASGSARAAGAKAARKGSGPAAGEGCGRAEARRGAQARPISARAEADDAARRAREAGERRAEREAAKERIEAARRDRAAARDALKSAREESRDARAEAKAAVRAAEAARRDADRATAAAQEAAERERAAQDALDAAEAALRERARLSASRRLRTTRGEKPFVMNGFSHRAPRSAVT